MRRSPDVSPRRLSDISPQLRQLKYLVVDEAIKEDLKWSRSVEDLTSGPVGLTSIEERILRITGYYGYQPWAASYKSKSHAPPHTLMSASSVAVTSGGGQSRSQVVPTTALSTSRNPGPKFKPDACTSCRTCELLFRTELPLGR